MKAQSILVLGLSKKSGELVILGIGALIFSILFIGNYLSFTGIRTNYTLANSTQITKTNIRTILSGHYPTALDKMGTFGILVNLQDVKVIGITRELDGDVHVDISDGMNSLVTEFIPERNLTLPSINQTINLVGVPYADTIHQGEIWHSQGSSWELHPIIQWSSNTIPINAFGNYTFINEPALEGA